MYGRKEFEWWMSDDGINPAAIERNGDGYKLMQAQQAWIAWSAGLVIGHNKGMVEAAVMVEQKAEQVRVANTFKGRINQFILQAVDWLNEAAEAIRQAAKDTPA